MTVSFAIASIYGWAHFPAGANLELPHCLDQSDCSLHLQQHQQQNVFMVTTVCCLCCCKCRLQSDWSTQCGSLAPAGKWAQYTKRSLSYYLKEAETIASRALLRCCAEWTHIPVAEHSQWRRFWRLKELYEKTVAVPCDTLSHTKSHRANKMESTMVSHIATHEQFPYVHRDQVAYKPLRLCPCLLDTILAAAGTYVAEPTTLPLYCHPHRRIYLHCLAFHLDCAVDLALNSDISNYSKTACLLQVPADCLGATSCSVGGATFFWFSYSSATGTTNAEQGSELLLFLLYNDINLRSEVTWVVFEVSELNEQLYPQRLWSMLTSQTLLLHCGGLTSELAKVDMLEHLTYINSYVVFYMAGLTYNRNVSGSKTTQLDFTCTCHVHSIAKDTHTVRLY